MSQFLHREIFITVITAELKPQELSKCSRQSVRYSYSLVVSSSVNFISFQTTHVDTLGGMVL